ncbi:hypothetical protein IFR05_000222 [Cadophora sp. M221]|nr:hypothetical protein IFR05_000222 [Cadophora sp. M221]
MSPTKPLIYAELLSNIRQISVIVALDASCGPCTKAELSADGQRFILQHDGDTTTLNLPGQAVTNFQLQKPFLGNKELSWRIPVAGQATRASIDDAQSNEAPWSAKELSEDAEFACHDCGAVIVKRGTIKVWKDLPSENWAEMMEFWHCHKPDVPAEEANSASDQAGHVHHKQTAAGKGYGATSKFTARAGTGFIDLTTFLLARSDCTNLKFVLATAFILEIERMRDLVLSEHNLRLLASFGVDAVPMRIETNTLAADFQLLVYSLHYWCITYGLEFYFRNCTQFPVGSCGPPQSEYIVGFFHVLAHLGHRAMYSVCNYTVCNFLCNFPNHSEFGDDNDDGDEVLLEVYILR